MFNIGDLVIYSSHGICKIDDISDKTIAGITRKYYIMHPLDNNQQLTISTPVDNEKAVIQKLLNKEEAREILESFKRDGIEWIEKPQERGRTYTNIVNTGNRKEIAKVANTLLKKKQEVEIEGRKFYEHDSKLLINIQNILFKELALALETTTEKIVDKINSLVS